VADDVSAGVDSVGLHLYELPMVVKSRVMVLGVLARWTLLVAVRRSVSIAVGAYADAKEDRSESNARRYLRDKNNFSHRCVKEVTVQIDEYGHTQSNDRASVQNQKHASSTTLGKSFRDSLKNSG
jgi:hypothetical protein